MTEDDLYREPTYGSRKTSQDDAFELIQMAREMLDRLKEKFKDSPY